MKTMFLKLPVTWPLAAFLLFPVLTRAETAVQAWAQRYSGPDNGDDRAWAMGVDGSNNVIVAGDSFNGTNSDYAVIKYSSAGVPLWTNRYNGPGDRSDVAYAVAVDRSNDVIVTGYSIDSGSGADYLTIKYSGTGIPLWTNRYNGSGNEADHANAVGVDGSNNVIVTGLSYDSVHWFSAYVTIKYSSTGVALWTNRYSGNEGSDCANAVVVDNSNNVIVTGYSAWGVGNCVYATVKYSTAGVPLWTNRYDGPRNYADAVSVDSGNNVIVTGFSDGGGTGYDYATVKYSSSGVPLWTNRYSAAGYGDDRSLAVAVDDGNNVIVTGYSTDSGSGADYLTIKYSGTGMPLWTNRYSGPWSRTDWAKAVAVDSRNNVIVTGFSDTGVNYDYVTIKYSSAGVPLWTNAYRSGGDDSAQAVVVDRNNHVIVTGHSFGKGHDYATVKYICVPEPVLIGLPPTDGTFQMRVEEVLQPGTLVIEVSTNLAGWEAIFTNTTPTNALFYADPDAANYPRRFYRAFQFP